MILRHRLIRRLRRGVSYSTAAAPSRPSSLDVGLTRAQIANMEPASLIKAWAEHATRPDAEAVPDLPCTFYWRLFAALAQSKLVLEAWQAAKRLWDPEAGVKPSRRVASLSPAIMKAFCDADDLGAAESFLGSLGGGSGPMTSLQDEMYIPYLKLLVCRGLKARALKTVRSLLHRDATLSDALTSCVITTLTRLESEKGLERAIAMVESEAVAVVGPKTVRALFKATCLDGGLSTRDAQKIATRFQVVPDFQALGQGMWSLMKLRKHNSAIELYEQARITLSISPNPSVVYALLVQCYAHLKDPKEMARAFRRGLPTDLRYGLFAELLHFCILDPRLTTCLAHAVATHPHALQQWGAAAITTLVQALGRNGQLVRGCRLLKRYFELHHEVPNQTIFGLMKEVVDATCVDAKYGANFSTPHDRVVVVDFAVTWLVRTAPGRAQITDPAVFQDLFRQAEQIRSRRNLYPSDQSLEVL